MESLVELTVPVVAHNTPVQELLVYVEYLPAVIRTQLFRHMSKFRLREMELAWEAAVKSEGQKPRDGFDPLAGDKYLFDRQTQREWHARVYCKDEKGRNFRNVFWEDEFYMLLQRRNQQHLGHEGEMMGTLKLFVDCVEVLKLSGRDICNVNAEILFVLRHVRRLVVYNFTRQTPSWDIISRVFKENCHLTKIGFADGSFSDREFGCVCTMITTTMKNGLNTCRISTLDLINVEIQPEGYRMLVSLVGDMPQLVQLSITRSINNFDNKLLVNATLRVPTLERLFLSNDNLGDDAFDGLAEIRKPLDLRYLHLQNNNVSFKTLGAICRASTDGVLNLECLHHDFNRQLHDPAIHALAPMLSSPVVGLATRLTHLNLRSCNFGLEGVTCLLLALGHNKTVKHLYLSNNCFGVGFGDVLAHFLLVNSSITDLDIDRVELELSGVSVGLLSALESNLTLTSLSLKDNKLRDCSGTSIPEALMKRAQLKPFNLVDLSFNRITLDGLKCVADIFDRLIRTNVHADSSNERDKIIGSCTKRQRVENSDKEHRPSSADLVPVKELRLLCINFTVNRPRGRECLLLIHSIRRHVGHLKSNA